MPLRLSGHALPVRAAGAIGAARATLWALALVFWIGGVLVGAGVAVFVATQLPVEADAPAAAEDEDGRSRQNGVHDTKVISDCPL